MSRVFAVAGWLLSLGASGASQRLLALLRALPDLLTPTEKIVVLHAGPPPLPARQGIECVALRIPARPTWRRVFAERRLLPGALRELDAALLHVESLPLPRVRCPVALTVHDLRDLGAYRRRNAFLFARVLRASVARAAALIAPSAFTAQELREATGARDVHVVPGVLDPDWQSGPARASPWPGAFLHVGHLEARKGLDTLLAAYARAGRAVALPPLVLSGRDAGAGKPLRRLAASLGVADRVHFLGRTEDATLRGLYRDARAVLLPSRYEGFGMPALEGLAFGRSVVVSDQGALREVVGDAGRVVPIDDVDAWAAVIVELATALDASPAAAARLAQAARFAPQAAAQTLLDVWRSCC